MRLGENHDVMRTKPVLAGDGCFECQVEDLSVGMMAVRVVLYSLIPAVLGVSLLW